MKGYFHTTCICTAMNNLPSPTPTHLYYSHFPLFFFFFFYSGESRHKFNTLCPTHEKVSGNACVSCESHVGHEQVLQCFLDGQSEKQGLAW